MADDMVFEVEMEELEVVRPRRRPRIFRRRPNYFEEYRDFEFIIRFRLSKDSVREIIDLIGDQISPIVYRNHAITPSEKILVTLRYYATGSFLVVSGDFMGISVSKACEIIHEVSHHIALLRPQFIFMPRNPDEIRSIQRKFYKLALFPKVIGSVDCTHVRLQLPGGDQAEIFRGRKGYFSRNVQAVTGPNLEILDIVTRWQGSAHDQKIFDDSNVKARLENGEFGNAYIVADSGYACRDYILVPLPEPVNLDDWGRGERLYNESLIRTRNSSERAFGVLKRRFPILSKGINVKNVRVDAIIVSCAVLYNIALNRNEGEPPNDPEVYIPVEATEDPMANRAVGRPYVLQREHLIANWFRNLQ